VVKKSTQSAAKRAVEQPAAAIAGLLESQLAQNIKDSAQQIWLAGLGAFAKAQGEPSKVFETLIKEGLGLQKKTQSAAEGKLGDMAGKVSAMAGEVGSKANAQWDKLESIFEERTARALGRLGVPNARTLAALESRVAALEAALKARAEAAPKAASRAAPKAAGKAAAGKAAAGKAAAAKTTAARKVAKASPKATAASPRRRATAPAAAPAPAAKTRRRVAAKG
jgi:poly(hydroxyalkanoate) granule-associated protein